jgi:pullulanase/glycogen debranching enzyme
LLFAFLSNGTPMFRAGDEFLQTQTGDPNPYNIDSPKTWLDWSRLDASRDVFRFFQLMINFRKSHPSLGRSMFLARRYPLVRDRGRGRHVQIISHPGVQSFGRI